MSGIWTNVSVRISRSREDWRDRKEREREAKNDFERIDCLADDGVFRLSNRPSPKQCINAIYKDDEKE